MLGIIKKPLFLLQYFLLVFIKSCARHVFRGKNMEEVTKRRNGLGIAGFIFSLIGLIMSWIPVVNIIGIVLCGIGFLLCLIGLFLKNRKKGLAIVGLLFSIAGSILFYLVYAGIAAGLGA